MSSWKVSCVSCGESFADEQPSLERLPCPSCGAIGRRIEHVVTATRELRDSTRAKQKRPSLPSKKKLRADVFVGFDLHHKSGNWYFKDRIVNKDTDYYLERVVDPKTGAVIHECEEKLSEHIGHGSAKEKK